MKTDDGLILIQKYTSEDDCLFCQKYGRLPIIKINFAPLLNRALYTKYSQSQWKGKKFEDFFSTKSIQWIIQFKDKLTYGDQDEFLKRYYPKSDQQNKLDQLLEYYKYHKDIPRMFLPKLSDLAIYFYEKKKQLEYRKIKIMLGIPIDDASNYTECEKLKEEIKVLNSITQQTQVSSLSLLRDMLKQKGSEEIVNIDATWITMANHQQTKSSQSSNLKLLKQLISKNTQFYKHKLNTNYTGLSKRNTQNSPQQNIHLKTLSKDTSQKSLLSSHKLINNSNGDSEFQKFLKQQMVGINHSNPCNQNNVKSIAKPIQISNYQSKQNSIHHLISTRSISSEQLKLIQSQQILKPNHTNKINQQSQHKKSQTQTHYTEINSPNKHKKQASNKLYTNIGIDFKQALTHTKSTDKYFKVYTSQSSIPLSTNINININQLNMNNLNIKSSFQQYKAMLESPKVNPKKKTQSNVETQRIHNASTQKSTTSFKKSQISVQQIYAQKIKQKHKIQHK
ncbi:unnamed protein product [Paramecium pentaurelia]|uniref:Uncharacterized protein n=1 Tax=Paramecium pentaurelia TaxID=43138 RepID=A0A8S1VF28_9CILI|nr:unnamed protein product [Paramecium pentaurelia]